MKEEIENRAVELSDEEVEKAAGGLDRPGTVASGHTTCPHCHRYYEYTCYGSLKTPPCPYCGYNPNTN